MHKSLKNIKKNLDGIYNVLSQKRVFNTIILIIFLIFLIGGIWIRMLGMPNLIDSTTGKYIPLALDPFYFLRVAETMIADSPMPVIDSMRYPALNSGFTTEFLPTAIVMIYKIANVFGNFDMRYIDLISPIVFFVIGIVLFFLLALNLSKSKVAAIVSTGILTIIPAYLYRTMAGFSDHEAIGMLAFFAVLLTYIIGLKKLDKKKTFEKKDLWITGLMGLLAGVLTMFTIASWGGIAVFIFMIFPLSFLIFWLVKVQNLENNKSRLEGFLIFYVLWFIFSLLSSFIFNQNLEGVLGRFVFSNYGLISLFTLVFSLGDYIIIRVLEKKKFLGKKEKYRVLYTAGIVGLLGIIFLSIKGNGFFSLISNIFNQLMHPFGTGRVGLTVAENKQPYLNDWIGQTGSVIFWLFYAGMAWVGIEMSKRIGKYKNKILFVICWIIMISGILFSRISETSLFNGTNLISKFLLIGSMLLFFAFSVKIYFEDRIKFNAELIFIFSWLLFMLIAARGAIRLFFAVTPFVCFIVGYFIIKLFNYARETKDELGKMIGIVLFGIIVISLIITSFNFVNISKQQAMYTTPSADIQWQGAMDWVRNNTPVGSVFIHWWDYGYWVQYLGERPTVTDGGHMTTFWDHIIGRYLLTTPFPESALSLMKTHNVSYLLIDPTDLGKYSAYSSIGDNAEVSDRFSWIPVMLSDESQTQETSTGVMRVYQGGSLLDQDIVYNDGTKDIFLPEQKAGIIAILVEIVDNSVKQPVGVYVYNNNQIRIPLRYLYIEDQLVDFKSGIEATVRIIPNVEVTSSGGLQIRDLGAAIYLSPKVMNSLFAQLYLMDDPSNRYPTLELAHSEASPVVSSLQAQGANLDEFVYYQGFRGPIKIWKVDYPDNIIAREEFLQTSESAGYGIFDDLQFTKQ